MGNLLRKSENNLENINITKNFKIDYYNIYIFFVS